VRACSAEALGLIRDASAVSALINLLNDNYEHSRTLIAVRKYASKALVNIGEPAVYHLVEALKDEDIRKNVIDLLIEIGEPALEPMNILYIERKIMFEEFDVFTKALKKKLKEGNFDKGCVAPPRKPPGNPDEMKRMVLPRPKTGNPTNGTEFHGPLNGAPFNRKPKTHKRCIAGG
jgi:hypothetical protein